MAQENEVLGIRLPPDIRKALEDRTKELRLIGDPMLSEASVARAYIVDGLRRDKEPRKGKSK